MTVEKLKEEIKKCKEDPIYFISKWVKVVHPMRGLVSFDLYPFQKGIVRDIRNKRFNILRKFRQAGCTTIAAAMALHMCNFGRRKTVGVLSKGDAEAIELIERIRLMYDELPEFLKCPLDRSNDHNLKFTNGSIVKSRASGKEAGRSLSCNLLIIDEAAFIEFIDTIWAAAYPTLSTGGAALVLSTVNGIGNWYHTMYEGAITGVGEGSEFNVIDIKWQDHPEYKRQKGYERLYEQMEEQNLNVDEWERITRANIGRRRFRQEYECEFLGTGETYINADTLKELKENPNNDYYIKYNNRMRIWADPHPAYTYCIGADVSLGRGRDYSAFHVINMYNGQQVAEFYSNKTPINEFAEIIAREATLYNIANVIPERNTIGNNLIDRLFNTLEYENIWMDTTTNKRDLGFQVTAKNKEKLLADMEEGIRMNKIKINSERLVDELLTFIVNENNKIEADKGCNDDLIMSMALSVYGFNEITGGTPIEHEISDKFNGLVMPEKSTYTMKSFGGVTEEEYLEWILNNG